MLRIQFLIPIMFLCLPYVTSLALDEMLDRITTSELYHNLKSSERAIEDMEKAIHDVRIVVQRSLNDSRIVQYVDLPSKWRHNPFVHHGYHFIVVDNWLLIILSLFALHNETHKQLLSFCHHQRSKEYPVHLTKGDLPL